jgi:CBS domain-containing protein
MGYGLPVEGEDGPFVGQEVSDVLTLGAGDTVADARSRLEEAGAEVAVVAEEGLAVGSVDGKALDGAADDDRLLEVMDVVPSTVRPSVAVAELAQSGAERVLVTTPDGRILGEATADAWAGSDGEGHDHGSAPDVARLEKEFMDTIEAAQEHFGDREPSEEELRRFLRDRLVSEGRTPEEADRFLAEMDEHDDG